MAKLHHVVLNLDSNESGLIVANSTSPATMTNRTRDKSDYPFLGVRVDSTGGTVVDLSVTIFYENIEHVNTSPSND